MAASGNYVEFPLQGFYTVDNYVIGRTAPTSAEITLLKAQVIMPFPSDLTIVLHAGAYKTATSTIQTLMAANREDILGRYGILYPKTATRRNTGSTNPASQAHHMLFHLLREDGDAPPDHARIARQCRKLIEEIDAVGARRVVLCSELFTSASHRVKAALVDLFDGARVQVLYTLRRPDDYLESMQNQAHKNFRTPGRTPERILPTLRNLKEWEALVGRDGLYVLPFARRDYARYLSRVFSILGIDPTDPLIDLGLHDNPAMTVNGFVMRRELMVRLKEKGNPISRDLCHRLNVELDALETRMPVSPKAIFLTRKDRRVAMQANRRDARKIASYMSPEESARFLADMAEPVLNVPRNVCRDLSLDPEARRIMNDGLNSAFFKKILA